MGISYNGNYGSFASFKLGFDSLFLHMKKKQKLTEAELEELKPRKASTRKELTEKARRYILEQAGLDPDTGKEKK